MAWLDRLERRLEPFAISNITLYLVIGQAFVYLGTMFNIVDPARWIFVPEWAVHGEPWRFITFIFIPPNSSWVFIAFALYFLYLTGSALESHWGVVRYNLFLLVGYVLTIGVSFLHPTHPATNLFLGGSIFLAFAYLYPNFELLLFFILPVKVKWLALLTWAYYGFAFVVGGSASRLAIVGAVGNFILFFGRDLVQTLRSGQRRRQQASARAAAEREPRHRCYVCGKTDLTNPEMDFRYCSKCSGDQCYCPEHIRNHVHVTTSDDSSR